MAALALLSVFFRPYTKLVLVTGKTTTAVHSKKSKAQQGIQAFWRVMRYWSHDRWFMAVYGIVNECLYGLLGSYGGFYYAVMRGLQVQSHDFAMI